MASMPFLSHNARCVILIKNKKNQNRYLLGWRYVVVKDTMIREDGYEMT